MSLMPSFLLVFCVGQQAVAPALEALPRLEMQGDVSAQMVAGIHRFLDQQTEQSVAGRTQYWKRDFSSPEAYERSVAANRARLRKYIGAVDKRVPVKTLEYVSSLTQPALVAATDKYQVLAVRWPVFENVFAEGLLLQPKEKPVARVVVLPDADQTPEMAVGLAPGVEPKDQQARLLAERGCQVLVPQLVNRQTEFSGNPRLGKATNQPHREWIYRQAFELGRHLIGYEVQMVEAAVDWFVHEAKDEDPLIAVVGYAQGGLTALYAAALDPRIDVAVVNGYFGPRERVWEEMIDRNVWRLLREFGDAEIATLVAPRWLLIQNQEVPTVNGRPPTKPGQRNTAAPGTLRTQSDQEVEREFDRIGSLLGGAPDAFQRRQLRRMDGAVKGVAPDGIVKTLFDSPGAPTAATLTDSRQGFDPRERQGRLVQQLVDHTQKLLTASEAVRDEYFKRAKPTKSADWQASMKPYREEFWNDVVGKVNVPYLPLKPRLRKFGEREKWVGYEVVYDVWPEVIGWGYLLIPKDLKPGERRPVVVCQHGLEGVPADTVSDDPKGAGYHYYKAFAARLAEQGYITYAPHNLYRGGDNFRQLARKLNPLGLSLFSIIVGQHDRLLEWLSSLPFVDSERIAFYGLSYGGKTAMRVPAILERYCLSICSGDFNEWVRKNASIDLFFSYMFVFEYEIYEWDLGSTFNYAEMAYLIAPRPFMVERGHDDGVSIDEWVAYEYAKVRRAYNKLGIGSRTEIEFFDGPHTIHGVGTYDFLRRHLKQPSSIAPTKGVTAHGGP